MEENFIRDFMLLFQGTEVPPLYAVWCGVAGVSAALGRRLVLRNGIFNVFPNVYIVLVGSSGLRKSTPIVKLGEIIESLDPSIRPNITPSSLTPAALVEALLQNKNETRLLSDASEGFALISELGNFLSKGAYEGGLPSLLIDLYDGCVHAKGTRMHGLEKITNPCFGFISGTTIDWIRDAIPANSIGGGLTSRFIFVYVEGRSAPVPIPFVRDYDKIMERLQNQLRKLCSISGEMRLSPRAETLYTEKYLQFHSSEFWDNPNLSGYAQRRANHLIKVSMLFAAANDSMIVEERHFESALSLILKSERNMPSVMSRITSSSEGENAEWIIKLIGRIGHRTGNGLITVARTALFREVVHKINSRDFNEIMDMLHSSGRIGKNSNGQDMYYSIKAT